MAIHPSAIKRHRQSLNKRARNIETKSTQLRAVNRALGKAVSKGIIKGNTASRWLSRLSRSAQRPTASS
ncbi:MAG: 30S ribosomal protein S20 [Deltaproteobacteria bacterium]|nr:MAG: 30S ribosomal protein S20 [Deltaproteobacteria bacterium]